MKRSTSTAKVELVKFDADLTPFVLSRVSIIWKYIESWILTEIIL